MKTIRNGPPRTSRSVRPPRRLTGSSMRSIHWGLAACGASIILASVGLLFATPQLPLEPKHDSGQGVTGAFEGWYKNPDGTNSILIGYYNRNLKQDLEIPV